MTRRTFHNTKASVCKTCYVGFPPSGGWPQAGKLHPYVHNLKSHLIKIGRWNALEDAIHDAWHIYRVQEFQDWSINNAHDFLGYASHLLTSWVPSETEDGKLIYYTLSLLYFILAMPGLQDLQTPVTPSSISGDLTIMRPVSDWVVGFAKRVGQWLDKPQSITPESYRSFINCPNYCMGRDNLHYQIPDPTSSTGGFTSFNHFFRRHIKDMPTQRPIASGNNTVVFPADATFDGAYPITQDSRVRIKGVSWPISSLLAGSKYSHRFAGGTWTHAFLNTYNYHRKHSPVAGTVVEAYNVEGCCYMQVTAKPDDDTGNNHLHLSLQESEPSISRSYMHTPNEAGYQFIQTRGVVLIDTAGEADIGLVAVIPMGMAIVSSVNLSVKSGQKVAKGQEISWFEFGGSDIVIVFEQKANARSFPELGAPPPQAFPPSSLVGQYYCTVGP